MKSRAAVCPFHLHGTVEENKAKLWTEDFRGRTTTVKTSLRSITLVPAISNLIKELSKDYTLVAAAATRLLNQGVESWLAEDRDLPQYDATMSGRIVRLVVSGGVDYQNTKDTDRQTKLELERPFMEHLVKIWNEQLRPEFGPGVSLLADDKFSEIMKVSFKQHMVNTKVHLTKTCEAAFKKWFKQEVQLLPWDLIECTGPFPQHRKNNIFEALLAAGKSRSHKIKIFCHKGGNTQVNDDEPLYLTETMIRDFIARDESTPYQWKSRVMKTVKVARLPPKFLKAMIDLVEEGRRQTTSYRGEFAVWFDEAWKAISWPTGLTDTASKRMKESFLESVSRGTEVCLGETLDNTKLIRKPQLRRASETQSSLILWYSSGKKKTTYKPATLTPQCVSQLFTLVEEAEAHYLTIRKNGCVGGVNDWNARLRFLRYMNRRIEETFVPQAPPEPRPPNWHPSTPPTFNLIPLNTYSAHYVSISSATCLFELYKTLNRRTNGEFKLPEGMTTENLGNREYVRELWSKTFDITQFTHYKSGNRIYKRGNGRLFNQTILSDGFGVSVSFMTSVSKQRMEEEPEMDDGDSEITSVDMDNEVEAKKELTAYEDYLNSQYEIVKKWKEEEADGGPRIRWLGIDPGGNATVTVVEESGFQQFGPLLEDDTRVLDGMPHYNTYNFSSARYRYDSGVGKWMKRMEKAKRSVISTDEMTDEVETIQTIENNMPRRNVTSLEDICSYNKYVMKNLKKLVGFYAEERYRFARFEHYIGKKRTINSLAHEIIRMQAPDGNRKTVLNTKENKRKKDAERKKSKPVERVVINFGSAKVGSMRHIRGSMKGPHKALMDQLLKMENVLVILEDEYLTSQVCVRCGSRSLEGVELENLRGCKCGEKHMVVTKKDRKQISSVKEALEAAAMDRIHSIPASVSLNTPWELKQCTNVECNARFWQRDTNAAANMLRLLNHRVASMLAGDGPLSRPFALQRKVIPQTENGASNN